MMDDIQELRNQIKKLKHSLKIAEHFNDKNNIDMLSIRATQRGEIIEKQNKEIQELKDEIEKLKNQKGIELKKNIRGAGRKSIFSEEDKRTIKEYRKEGKTIKELARIYSCSVGLIHKIINE